MNLHDLFIDVLQRPDVADHAALLEKACGIDTDLRDKFEVLLREHGQLGNFLESLLGPTVGACHCLKCIVASATGSWSRPEANGMTENVSRIFAPC
jgi:hypothetical protein